MCVRHLSSNQNAALHYKAVCRALVTESRELKTFLDRISSEQEFLAKSSGMCENPDGLDNLQRADWARLWVQIMGELRHGVRLKKVEHIQLSPMEYELTPFEILMEDIRLGRYKLNRIMVNGDIAPKVKQDAHAVILDFIRSRPPLKSVKKRVLSSPPKKQMDPRELLMHDICQQAVKLKPVQKGRLVVGANKSYLDSDHSSDEDSPKHRRKVIKPVAAFEVSTDDSDESYMSDTVDDEGRYHVKAPVMSPMSPVSPENGSWKRAVAKDLVQQPSCQNLERRHSIGVCNSQSTKKVPILHAEPLMEENVLTYNDNFVRGHANRKATRTKLVSYRQSHGHVHDNTINRNSASVTSRQRHSMHENEMTLSRPQSPGKHGGHSVMSRTHSDIDVVACSRTCLHDVSCKPLCVSSDLHPTRSLSPCRHSPRPLSPCMHAARSESPIRFLSRSHTFTTNTSRQNVVQDKPIVISRCDSPQTRKMTRSDSFPPPECESQQKPCMVESPRRHSVHNSVHGQGRACDSQHGRCVSPHRKQALTSRADSRSRNGGNRSRSQSPCRRVSQSNQSKHVNMNNAQFEQPKYQKSKVKSEQEDQNKAALESNLCKSVPDVRKFHNLTLQESKSSHSPQELEVTSENYCETFTSKLDDVPFHRSRPALVRARSRPEVRPTSLVLKSQKVQESKTLRASSVSANVTSETAPRKASRSRIPRTISLRNRTDRISGANSEQSSKDNVDKRAPNMEIKQKSEDRSAKTVKFRSQSETLWLSIENRVPVVSNTSESTAASDASSTADDSSTNSETPDSKQRPVRLSRQHAIRSGRADLQSGSSCNKDNPEELRTRRSGVVTQGGPISGRVSESNCEIKSEQQYQEVSQREPVSMQINKIPTDKQEMGESHKNRNITIQKEVSPQKTILSPSQQRIMVSSPQRIMVSPQKVVSQRQQADVLIHNSDKSIVSPTTRHAFKEVRPILRSRSEVRRKETGPVKGSHVLDTDNTNKEQRISHHVLDSSPTKTPKAVPIVGDNTAPQSKIVTEKVEEITGAIKAGVTNVTDLLHHKWQNPIQCLSLTLEEVTHIRMVLTKAEHESLITDTELYNAIGKGKVCFTCKKTKFSLFGQWGTKCKFCQRTVCNYCLRKMNVPTEHFEKIPVYSLSPVPISPEVLEVLKVYESTGSVPQSPSTSRREATEEQLTNPAPPRTTARPSSPSPDETKLGVKRSNLQRSHTIGVGAGSRPLPNKALLKGPQMSICCDCKTMIMEIIRASRTTVSLVNKPGETTTKEAPVVSLRPRVSEDRSRPRSMMGSLTFKSFDFSKKESDL